MRSSARAEIDRGVVHRAIATAQESSGAVALRGREDWGFARHAGLCSLGVVRKRRVESLTVREWGDPAEPGVLLWPGLGATGVYFESLVDELPFRAVAVDPPGVGASAPIDPCTYGELVRVACAIVERCECRAVVGHSLGAYVAVGVAAAPPAGLDAAVLIDGGFMEAEDMAQVGLPITAGRAPLVEWLAANTLRFPDWDTATRELAAMIGSDETPAFTAYVRGVFAEIDGEIHERSTADQAADLLLGTFDHEVRALAERLRVPTLLIACGQPAEQRALRERSWRAFAAGSALVQLHVADEWGHNPIFQDPEAFSTLTANWLHEHVAARGQ
jgi:pimeloyl-ACP methyl ester carboxylesterase